MKLLQRNKTNAIKIMGNVQVVEENNEAIRLTTFL